MLADKRQHLGDIQAMCGCNGLGDVPTEKCFEDSCLARTVVADNGWDTASGESCCRQL
ncbi:hypothetical protein SynA1825c_01080 [Synechococcus sp. A18-25c]|nr:hypothetical protein SynA1825c_01080 [Synechococcus sp. A18-25c]